MNNAFFTIYRIFIKFFMNLHTVNLLVYYCYLCTAPAEPNENFRLLSSKELTNMELKSIKKTMDGLNAVPTTRQEKEDCAKILSPQQLHQIVIGLYKITYAYHNLWWSIAISLYNWSVHVLPICTSVISLLTLVDIIESAWLQNQNYNRFPMVLH